MGAPGETGSRQATPNISRFSTPRLIGMPFQTPLEFDYSHFDMKPILSYLRVVFGLKFKRLAEWRMVLEEEGRFMTWRNWLHMANQALRAFTRPPSPDVYRHRLLTCQRCPLFDRGLKRCRPYTGSDYGCGCYVPYRAKAAGPCWIREQDPQNPLGWN